MNKQIVVIEDDKSILDAIKMALEFDGYAVTTSEKGDYADKIIKKKAPVPDAIILDILLSGKDGRIICKKLKNHTVTKDVPIIMMSAHPGAETSVKEVGADRFLPKPFAIDELLLAVKKYTA